MNAPADAAAHTNRSLRADAARDVACVALLVLLTLAVWLPLLTQSPAPGGDEPGFVDPAATLARQGFLGTAVYQGQLPGMERHVYWQPPVYFLALGLWFKAFGIGLVQARLFSVLCGLVIVVCVYRLARFWASPAQAAGPSLLCAVSVWVQQGARLARMDALCVAFLLLCAATYLWASRRPGRTASFSLAGTFAGLALLTHPLGLVAVTAVVGHLLWRPASGVRRPQALAAVLLPVALCLLGWLAYIGQDVGSFRVQMHAQAARRALYAEPPFWFWFFVSKIHVWTLAVLLTGGLAAAKQTRRLPQSEFITLLAFLALAAATYGRLSFYFLYFVPLFCVTLALCLRAGAAGKRAAWGLALALGVELVGGGRDALHVRHTDYARLSRTVRAAVPPGRSVFLSYSSLSPYFALYGRNPLRVAAPVPLPPGCSMDRVVGGCDYIAVPTPLIDTGLRHWIAGKQPVASVNGGALSVYRLR